MTASSDDSSALDSSAPLRFDFMGREWIGRLVVNEADTKLLPRVTPTRKGRPWPKREHYYGAMAKFKELRGLR